jgi:hypothetical protein
MGTTTNNWLKRIFSVTTLTTVLTIVGTCIAIIQYVESNGGSFVAFLNGKEVTPPVKNTILVYLDKDSADLSQIGIFPQISNPSKYSLQDVLLTYKIASENANVSFTDYFSVHRVANGSQVTNNDKTLYAKTDMPEPFYYFVMKDKGEASIDLKATYKGVEQPFTFQADVYARKLYRADREQRKKEIFNDAYEFANYKNLSDVDLYILEDDKIESFKDISLKKPYIENTISVQPTNIDSNNEIKTIEQVKTDNAKIIKETKENQGTPWYMELVAVILMLITILCLFALAFASFVFADEKPEKNDRIPYYIFFIVGPILTYVGFYYSYLLIGDPILKFVAGFINYIIIISALICGLNILIKIDGRQELDVFNPKSYFIAFIVVLVAAFIYFLCLYIYDIVPF